MMVVNRHPTELGQTLPPAEPHRRLGGVLLCAGDCLGLFLAIVLIFAC
jgi:hypothetical protein